MEIGVVEMKERLALCAVCIAVTLSAIFAASCGAQREEPLALDESESITNDPYTDGEYVFYPCTLAIVNRSDEICSFSVTADFSEEYKNGIITQAVVQGIFKDDGENGGSAEKEKRAASVSPDSACRFDVVFKVRKNQGYSGTALKSDRNLPDITVTRLD